MQAARNTYRTSLVTFMSGIVLARQSVLSSPAPSHLHPLVTRSVASLPSPRRGPAAMPGAWGGLQQLANFVARRPLTVCLGVTAASAGLWAAQVSVPFCCRLQRRVFAAAAAASTCSTPP